MRQEFYYNILKIVEIVKEHYPIFIIHQVFGKYDYKDCKL